MMTFKQLIADIFLSKEIAALKTLYTEASTTLDKVEAAAVGIAKEAPAEVHTLASEMLTIVLSSADKVRTAAGPVEHAWAAKAYALYAAGKADVTSVINKAIALAKSAKIFIAAKL